MSSLVQNKLLNASYEAGWLQSLRTRLNQYRVYRHTLNELRALSDRELADLGLHRSMLRRIASQAAYEAS